MQNLIIHPKDPTTVFLKPIYAKAENKIVIEEDACPDRLETLIRHSDRVMMMGHGSPQGLFSMGLWDIRGRTAPYAICDKQADILRDQQQNIYIWCHANKFVDAHNLHGFYSGMFVSEVYEAYFCGIPKANRTMVEESNKVFSESVGEHIDLSKEELYESVRKEYGKIAESNPVASYNLERLCVK